MKGLLIALLFSSVGLFAQNKEINTFYDNGAIKSTYHYSDASNYEVSNYYMSGKLMETGRFVNGKMDGTWISYNESGLKSGEASYVRGEKSGEWKMYDETGSMRYKIVYANNRIVNAVNFDASGRSIAESKSR
jgi:antitoxin component YwqK of YwqJK toxin-antitoxin module